MIGGFIEVHDFQTDQPRLVSIDHIIAIMPGLIEKRNENDEVTGRIEQGTDIYTDSSKRYCDIYCIQVSEDYRRVKQLISEGIHRVFDAYRRRVGS